MKLINDILFLELAELVECGLERNTILVAKSRGSKAWHFADDPDDRRRVLIGYEKLSAENKAKVEARFGNPYDHTARQPLLEMVVADPVAHDFYLRHEYDRNGIPVTLTPAQVAQSTRAAAWLALVAKVTNTAGWKEVRAALGLKAIPDFFGHAGALIALEVAAGKIEKNPSPLQLPGNFPTTYQRLKERAATFQSTGFQACLPLGLGNKKAAKIGKTEEGFSAERETEMVAVLRKIAGMHNNFDAAQVTDLANTVFRGNGWETITVRRVRQLMDSWQAELTPGRRGKRAYRSDVSMQVKREAPVFPLTYWTLDGWTAELLYQANGKYHYRLDVVVVLDPAGKYPIGYAIGDQENTALIRAALRNALQHVHELFGAHYRPTQLQSDNYGKKALAPFYQAASGLYTPAQVGNAKAKVIEPYFMYLNKEYCQKMPNWSGFGTTARKENQVNTEFLQMIRHNMPDRAGVVKQIEWLIACEREKKVADFRNAFATAPADRNQVIDYLSAEWLLLFGEQMGDRTSTISGKGLQKTIDGQTRTYDSFDPLFRSQMHLDWTIMADRADLSKVLAVSPDFQQRFVLEQKMAIPMAVVDQAPEHHAYRAKVTAYNKTAEQKIIDQYTATDAVFNRVLNATPELDDKEAEAVLRLMPTYGGQQKQQLQQAKRLGTEATDTWAAQQAAYLADKHDFSNYLNND